MSDVDFDDDDGGDEAAHNTVPHQPPQISQPAPTPQDQAAAPPQPTASTTRLLHHQPKGRTLSPLASWSAGAAAAANGNSTTSSRTSSTSSSSWAGGGNGSLSRGVSALSVGGSPIIRGHQRHQGFACEPLPPQQQRQLVELVWGDGATRPEAAWQQGLLWSEAPGLEWGLQQLSGGYSSSALPLTASRDDITQCGDARGIQSLLDPSCACLDMCVCVCCVCHVTPVLLFALPLCRQVGLAVCWQQ